jgi:hypothetical protein
MKRKTPRDSFYTMLKIAFGVLLGVVLLAVFYQAVTNSGEIRSKASQAQYIPYMSWDFNGTTTEGWNLGNLTGFKVANGFLTASTTNYDAILINKSVTTTLPVGNKYVDFRLALIPPPQPTSKPVPQALAPTKSTIPTSPVSQVPPFFMTLSYTIQGVSQQKVLPPVPATGFGNLYEYTVKLPDISSVRITSIQLTIKPVRAGMVMQLDFVKLLASPVTTSRPTPTIVCKTGVNTFTVDTPCTGGYRYMTFICYDGYTQKQGGPTSCKTSDIWSTYAKAACAGRSNCSTSPIPTSWPVPATPTPTPSYPQPTAKPISTPPPTSSYPQPTVKQMSTPTPTPSYPQSTVR